MEPLSYHWKQPQFTLRQLLFIITIAAVASKVYLQENKEAFNFSIKFTGIFFSGYILGKLITPLPWVAAPPLIYVIIWLVLYPLNATYDVHYFYNVVIPRYIVFCFFWGYGYGFIKGRWQGWKNSFPYYLFLLGEPAKTVDGETVT
jgi:hypothetical protein